MVCCYSSVHSVSLTHTRIVNAKQRPQKKFHMSSTTSIDVLTPLKVGSILTKLKRNGEKHARHFYLDEHEDFISYHQSDQVFAQAPRCKRCTKPYLYAHHH